jgi:hypothetical protein
MKDLKNKIHRWARIFDTDGHRLSALISFLSVLICVTTLTAQTYTLRGWATTTGSGTLTQGNWGMFATFGQPAAGIATQGNYSLYMGVIRPGSAFSISGYTKYYKSPNFYPVANTQMFLTGGQLLNTLTDVNGYYSFAALTGFLNDTVTPRKINAANQAAITSYDAALILRHVVGMITLDSLQRIAADVSGNGSISSFDAAQVLQYAVAIRHHFPAGYRPGSDTVDWAFRPAYKAYTPLQSNQTDQNYVSILYGDVSGNWTPSDMIPKYTNPAETEKTLYYQDNFTNITPDNVIAIDNASNTTTTTELTLSPTNQTIVEKEKTASEPDLLSFPIDLKEAKSVISADIILKYDPKTITLVDIKTASNTSDFLYAYTEQAGIIRIGLAGTKELNGNTTLFNVRFKKNNNNSDAKSELTIKSLPVEVLYLMTNEQKIKESTDGVAGNYVELPTRLSLMPNQPNPFKTQTEIRYGLPGEGNVSLTIYDVSGTMIRTLVNGNANPGFYSVSWNGNDERGMKMAPGVYFYVLKSDNAKIQRKMLMLE